MAKTKFYNILILIGLFLIALFGYSTARSVIASQIQPTYTPLSAGSSPIDQEIQLYENLFMRNMSEKSRQLLQGKLNILYAEATQQYLGMLQATEIFKTGTPVPRPTIVFRDQRDTGIIQNPSSPFSYSMFHITNAWQEKINGTYVLVWVGARGIDPTQGVVIVMVDPPSPSVSFYTPNKSGAVKITDFKGYRLILSTLDGSQTYYFDVPGMQFVDSLDEIVSTATPLPTETPIPFIPTLINPYPNP